MIFLGVNIDHCATIRQARYKQAASTAGRAVEPDPVTLAERDVWRHARPGNPPGRSVRYD
jgi:pyridoxine 5'-phosphate synthase PdxJ